MLSKIREKSQGVFAWVILLLICVPFALWGIQNYVGGGSEAAIVSVNGKDFFQDDLNRAYSQFTQNLAGKKFDENLVKKQAMEKLIQDEILLQHAQGSGLVATDKTAREFIKSLEYFKTDGKFDNKQYKAMLATQRMAPAEFVKKIKKALMMDQFQRAIVDSGFATQSDIDAFFKIQNQTRDVEVISIALNNVEEQPSSEEIESYYQQRQQEYLTDEQASIEYVELALDDLAKQVEFSDEQLKAYYDERKDLYTTKERRKISHILFSFTKNTDDDEKQLQRAINAKKELNNKTFSVVASEQSDDKLTASKGGDLGLFNVGVMEKSFEDTASSLKLGEVSQPIKSSFGYHLIKVTELVESKVKSFEAVKKELTVAYQKAESENNFYELGETLTGLSFETPDSLIAVADGLGVEIKKTALFGRNVELNKAKTDEKNITAQLAIINTVFSEDVLKGNNSEPIELGNDRLVVLRILEHKPAEIMPLKNVKGSIVGQLLKKKAIDLAIQKAKTIKSAVVSGQTMESVAKANGEEVKVFSGLNRGNGDLSWQLNQAAFKAAKPMDGKSTVVIVAEPAGSQAVINVTAVTQGVITDADKAKSKLLGENMASAFGRADLDAALNSLRKEADIRVNTPQQQ